mmetsp:Transcript_43524/g.94767  ORF Transcript_43524/g.94767 Transcript_43524/m.94767 type:complete len:859 (+) Transcript_43524:98-2674(+)|eukprot:CAMPEP_0170600792 /NCGR_PEP_ID=MMETSP0224-20130122/17518_1 /TAXON_ID=285029 /ORGANISM="Togula jolla, Strain CCCM 725" /LENGTH=858 /DNA_ID=CAMNT_0010925531 /DNA_START=29 /DNA_END=2605 /DNA_ORIENTATION=-
MAVYLNRVVEIQNKKLEVCHWSLLFIVYVLIALKAFTRKEFTRSTMLGDHLQANFWGIPPPHTELMTEHNASAQLCSSAALLDYWYDNISEFYVGHRCMAPCGPEDVGLRCLRSPDMSQRMDKGIFFASSFTERGFMPGQRPTLRQYIFPAVQIIPFGFTYSFKVPVQDFFGYGEGLDAGSSTSNITTVLLRHDGSVARIIPPRLEISLPLKEMFALAGHPELLDEIFPELGPNVMPGAHFPQGPVTRIAGGKLKLHLACYNYKHLEIDVEVETPHLCELRVVMPGPSWTARRSIDITSPEGGNLDRNYHGIEVAFEYDGEFQFWDFEAIFLIFIVCLIFHKVPTVVVQFIALNMMGHLSVIYRGIVQLNFDIGKTVSGMAMRLGMNSMLFAMLRDSRDGISQVRMNALLQRALSVADGALDNGEIQQVVKYCYADILRPRRKSTMLERISHKPSKESLDGGCSDLQMDGFLECCAASEPLPLGVVVDLFDRDRRRGLMEQFFTPPSMQATAASRFSEDHGMADLISSDLEKIEGAADSMQMKWAEPQPSYEVPATEHRYVTSSSLSEDLRPILDFEIQRKVEELTLQALSSNIDKVIEGKLAELGYDDLLKRMDNFENGAGRQISPESSDQRVNILMARVKSEVAKVEKLEKAEKEKVKGFREDSIASTTGTWPEAAELEMRLCIAEETLEAATLENWTGHASLGAIAERLEKQGELLEKLEEQVRDLREAESDRPHDSDKPVRRSSLSRLRDRIINLEGAHLGELEKPVGESRLSRLSQQSDHIGQLEEALPGELARPLPASRSSRLNERNLECQVSSHVDQPVFAQEKQLSAALVQVKQMDERVGFLERFLNVAS